MIAISTSTEPDLDVVRRCRRGEEAAFAELHAKYADKVLRFARRFIQDEQYAEDVAQEVFLRIFRKIDSFRGDSLFSTWLFRITMNTCRNKRRSLAREQRLDLARVAAAQVDPIRPPADEISGAELEEKLDLALGDLSEEQRRLLAIRANTELSYDEIGSSLGQTGSQVRGKLYRARKALRWALANRSEYWAQRIGA